MAEAKQTYIRQTVQIVGFLNCDLRQILCTTSWKVLNEVSQI